MLSCSRTDISSCDSWRKILANASITFWIPSLPRWSTGKRVGPADPRHAGSKASCGAPREHPQFVGNGARRSRRFDVARFPALAEYSKFVALLTLKRTEVRARAPGRAYTQRGASPRQAERSPACKGAAGFSRSALPFVIGAGCFIWMNGSDRLADCRY